MSIAGVVVVSSPYWGPIVIKAFEAAIVTVVAGATAIAGV